MSHSFGSKSTLVDFMVVFDLFGSNKKLPLPPGPLIWSPMDLVDLQHVLGGLIKPLEAHKVH